MGCPFHKNSSNSFFTIIKKFFGIKNSANGFGLVSGMAAANLQAILDTTVDSIITIDENRIIKAFNKTAEGMFGYSKEEIIGKNVNVLMPEPFHSEHDGYVLNYLRTGQKKIIGIGREVLAKKKDGKIFPIDLAVSEVIVENSRLFTGIIRDISAKKEADKMKVENLRIEAEIKAKNEFITMISHELRTPLHSIMGFTECLLNKIDGPITEEQKTSLQHSYSASQHLLQLVNGILALSKIDLIKEEKNTEKCNIIEILDNCLITISPLASQKSIELIKEVPDFPVIINANPKHIHQIFLNLLSNAVKFTDQGKVVSSIIDMPDKIKIAIHDTGIGITSENLVKIFTPFVNIAKNTKKVESVGLGLAITKRLVEIYNGTIEVKSKRNDTTVTIYLPKETKDSKLE